MTWVGAVSRPVPFFSEDLILFLDNPEVDAKQPDFFAGG
jgi:hypothetical protein